MSRRLLPLLLTFATLLTGCERSQDQAPTQPATAPVAEPVADDQLQQQTREAWELLAARTGQCRDHASLLQQASDKLLQTPTDSTLQAARSEWEQTHHCLQTLAPLMLLADASPSLFAALADYRYLLDAYPIQPGYIDYFDVYTHSGLVNDISMPLTAQNLRQQHGLTDPEDVSLGMHAIAYLLWGEAGNRPVSDFAASTRTPENRELSSSDLPQNRRRTLLQLQVQLLSDDLRQFHNQLQVNQPLTLAYMALPPTSRLQLWQQTLAAQLKALEPWLQQTKTGAVSSEAVEPAWLNHGKSQGQQALAGWMRLTVGEDAPFSGLEFGRQVGPLLTGLSARLSTTGQ